MGGSEHASFAGGVVCMTGGLVAYFRKGSGASLAAGGALCGQVNTLTNQNHSNLDLSVCF